MGCLDSQAAATSSFEEPDFAKKNEGINNNLIKAQNIVAELTIQFDMTVPGELPGTLYRLYDYVLNNLQQANLKRKSKTYRRG